MDIHLTPVAFVRNSRSEPIDDNWGDIISEIELASEIPSVAFQNIAQFSHLEIIYYFDQVSREDIMFSSHPRGNKNYPLSGIFSQRKKDRPNGIGLCTVKLVAHFDRTLIVKNLDAINGSPVL